MSPGTALEVLLERAVAMREAGNAQLAIASALGVHKNTVQRWLKHHPDEFLHSDLKPNSNTEFC